MEEIKRIILFYTPIVVFITLLIANIYHFDSLNEFFKFFLVNVQSVKDFFESMTNRQFVHNLFLFYAPIFVFYNLFVYPRYKKVDFMDYRAIRSKNEELDLICFACIAFVSPLMIITFIHYEIDVIHSIMLIFVVIIMGYRVLASLLLSILRLCQIHKEKSDFEYKSLIFNLLTVVSLIGLNIFYSFIF